MDSSEQFGPIDVVAIGELVESAAPERERLRDAAMVAAQAELIECLDRDRDYWRKQALGEQWPAAAAGVFAGALGAVLILAFAGVLR